MAISNVCENYFRGFEEISQWRSSRVQDIVLAVLKIISYLTVIIPLVVGVVYGVSSRYGRFDWQTDLEATTLLPEPPKIECEERGRIVISYNGKYTNFKHVVITPSGNNGQNANAVEWDLSKTGMNHDSPKLRVQDVEHYLFSNSVIPQVVILTKGWEIKGEVNQGWETGDNPGGAMLEIDGGVKDYCIQRGVKDFIVCNMPEGAKHYRELLRHGEESVAAMIYTGVAPPSAPYLAT